jgi:predicted nucleic-acid-binding protein
MKLVDTVAIIGFLNQKDRLHARSTEHLQRVSAGDEEFVPTSSLIEADLAMRLRGYTDSEREESWRALEGEVPAEKVVPNSVPSIRYAVELQKNGMGYFDSLVASPARETDSIVITTDKRIGEAVEIEW